MWLAWIKGGEQVAKVGGGGGGGGGIRPLIVYCDNPLGGSGGMLPQKILEISTL